MAPRQRAVLPPSDRPARNGPRGDRGAPPEEPRESGGGGPIGAKRPLEDERSAVLPWDLSQRPSSVLLHGPSRELVNLAVFALATATSDQPQWVEIGDPAERRSPVDPIALGWVPAERCWSMDSSAEFRPGPLGARLAMFGYVRSDEPREEIDQISDFLNLPEASQRILALPLPEGRPGVVAVANADRVLPTYSAPQLSAVLRAHRRSGFSLYLGAVDPPGLAREVFDYVFHLDGGALADWARSGIRGEKGVDSGPMARGQSMALGDIPLFARPFSMALASR